LQDGGHFSHGHGNGGAAAVRADPVIGRGGDVVGGDSVNAGAIEGVLQIHPETGERMIEG